MFRTGPDFRAVFVFGASRWLTPFSSWRRTCTLSSLCGPAGSRP